MNQPRTDQVATNGKRRRALLGLTLTIAVSGIGYFLYWFFDGRFYISTDDAYVAGNRIVVSPRTPGTVTEIAVDSTDPVRAGETLVRLDGTDARIALQKAKARLSEAVRQTQARFREPAALSAQLTADEARQAQARRDWQRARRLARSGAIAREKLEQAHTAWIEARAQTRAAQAGLARVRALVRHRHLHTDPAVLAAEASVREAYAALTRGAIRAPVSGYVAKRSVQLGQQVAPGQPLMIILPLRDVWVDANFKERDLAGVAIGDPVTLTADWYGSGIVFHGRVEGIEPGSGSAFSLLPPENASGNWIKIVQRVPVRIALDRRELASHPLRLGLSVQVTVSIRHRARRPLPPVHAGPRYQTSIYGTSLEGADRIIASILHDNLTVDHRGGRLPP